MKRFEKILKITAIICAVVFAMGAVGTIIGVNKVFNGDISAMGINISNSRFFETGEQVVNSFEKNKVKDIDINADIGNVVIKENPKLNEIKVTGSHAKYTQMELIEGTLNLRLKDNRFKKFMNITNLFGVNGSNRSIVVELPKDYILEGVKANVDVGEINITASGYKNLDVTTKLGAMKLLPSKYTLLNNLNVTNSMGDTEIVNLDGVTSKIKNSMGKTKITIDNEVNPKAHLLDIDNNMGDVYVSLKNIDRNIDISCNMGSVDLVSKNHLSRDVAVDLDTSMGEAKNGFQHNDTKLNKAVEVSVDVDMGSATLKH